MELTLDDTLREIIKMMADEEANPIVANFSNLWQTIMMIWRWSDD